MYNYTIMRSILKKLSQFIWHPFQIILFALLALLVANYGRLPFDQMLRPLVIFFVLAALFLLVTHQVVKDWGEPV